MGIPTTRTKLGPHFSEGARLVWMEIERRGWTQGQLRKELKVATGRVSRWLYGDIRVSLSVALLFQKTLHVPAEAWTLAPTVEFVVPAARPVAA
jgi:transcriptional regulator with XRE-family HTH domain